ncbi:Mpv17 / PMP22 family [Novymonas esmeraldas]|uniref:Mpv17 / PMP22 family n=1 Tax=Novymonas esmeraldas TaxID=1808958 RepID=A0AAW0EVW7_9TRYP
MKFLLRTLSYYLKEYPLRTNMALSTTVGFCGDIVCQTIYEPCTQSRPPLTRERLPTESQNSPFLITVQSPYLFLRQRWLAYQASRDAPSPPAADGSAAAPAPPTSSSAAGANTTVLLDLRRSMIFCSFTFLFGVPYFLWVYRHLDRLINPATITKRSAVGKGFLSYLAAQLTNPIYLTYVTAMDHFFIYRDGRDGRRRVMAIPMNAAPKSQEHVVVAGDDEAGLSDAQKSPGRFRFIFRPFRNTTSELDQTTIHKMGYYYRIVDNHNFNPHEYYTCVSMDVKRKLIYDFPDIMKYALAFWSLNWLPMFYYIPGHFRLAYSSGVQVVWSGIMSHMLHRWKKLDGEDIRMKQRLHTL